MRIELDGTILYANSAATRMFTETSLVNRRFRDLLTTGGGILYETQFMPALRLQGRVNELFFEVLDTCGNRLPVLVSGALEEAASAQPATALIVLFAATQRRQYERELLEKRKQFERIVEIVDRSSDAILRVSPQLVIESWNEGAREIFGYTRSEAIGKSLSLFLNPEVMDSINSQLNDLNKSIDVVTEMSVARNGGNPIDVSLRLTPHLEPPGKTVGYSAILRDITSRKIAERALLQADKLASVSRLASSISHELNNPLAAVTNLLYLLQTGAKDEETRALVEAAQSELARVSQIASHALRFHRQSTRRTEVDLAVLFRELLSLYKGRFAGSRIVATSDTEGLKLVCHEGELKQVLVNLVSNAFDAMRHGGELRLRSREVTSWPSGEKAVRITIADSGTGFDPEAMRHLFEPFFSTKGINGAGLGLWISKDLVERNGGRICVRSSVGSPSRGTIVSLFFTRQS